MLQERVSSRMLLRGKPGSDWAFESKRKGGSVHDPLLVQVALRLLGTSRYRPVGLVGGNGGSVAETGDRKSGDRYRSMSATGKVLLITLARLTNLGYASS